jgi:environmental stress-induced protein Ves
MRILRSSEYRRMPWKNGGGETTEIAVAPEGAALDAFDWRISMASVAADGPFSAFPGIDRTLTVLSGAGMRLELAATGVVELTPEGGPLAFSGDEPAHATLLGGPITDLNVMTRRTRFGHRVHRQVLAAASHLPRDADVVIILCAGGGFELHAAGERASLTGWDAAIFERDAAPAVLSGAPETPYFHIRLDRR